MEKKIMLALDDSVHSRRALEYVVRMSSAVKDLTYTLFNVQPTISQFLLDEAKKDAAANVKLKKVINKNAEIASRILESYKDRMIRMGIAENCINVTTQTKKLGLAKDIMEFGHKGLYDAMVVGRRGLSRLQETFVGSVTANLLEHSSLIPVWVVDGDVTSTKIMIAVDGSESSLCAVDHLGFMVGDNPEIKITLFHVIPKAKDYCEIDFEDTEVDIEKVITQGDKRCIDRFYAHARHKFMAAGIQENQIEIKVTERTFNVAKAILEEAKRGNYGTVVIGRRGTSKAFFMGSVSRYVLAKTSNRALWLVS